MHTSFTCPTCAWIFLGLSPVPGHPDPLLGRTCHGVGAAVEALLLS